MKTPIKIQMLFDPFCASRREIPNLVKRVVAKMDVDAELEERIISTEEEAEEIGFRGSPSVLVNGQDLEPVMPGNPLFSMG